VAEPTPLKPTHSHNDYMRERPLFDALDAGLCSVEADVFLIDGELRVAHDLAQTKPGRTLRSLYLEPLARRVRQNHGSVYKQKVEVMLLIDVKDDAEKTWQAIRKELSHYRFMLATTKPGAIRVVISGNRAIDTITGDKERLAGIDGRLSDLPSRLSFEQMPLISDSWTPTFKFRGGNPLSEAERVSLRSLVRQVHRAGRRIRFWGVPDNPVFWGEMRSAGVDFINTDTPAKLADWFRKSGS
jgi:glycerophosphoryl diester phosphodiesterase